MEAGAYSSDVSSSRASTEKWNSHFLFASEPGHLPQTVPLYSVNHPFSLGQSIPESFAAHSDWSGNSYKALADHSLYHDSRTSSGLSDTRKWPLPPTIISPCATSQPQFPSMNVGLDVSQILSDSGASGFIEGFTFDDIPPAIATTDTQATLHTQPIMDLSSTTLGPARYHDPTLNADPVHPIFRTSVTAFMPSSRSTQDFASYVRNYPPDVIYRAPERRLPARRHSPRSCAINIEGLWIDRDDLYSGADRGSGTIRVYECQWEGTSNPCGMWFVGSRSRFGAHVRKWHTRRAKSATQCLWDTCAKTMLKDSINRHVVNVHLNETFHCRGCACAFPRQDVYNRHVRESETCRDAGAAIVYGTESRVLDARRVLQQGEGIHYSS